MNTTPVIVHTTPARLFRTGAPQRRTAVAGTVGPARTAATTIRTPYSTAAQPSSPRVSVPMTQTCWAGTSYWDVVSPPMT